MTTAPPRRWGMILPAVVVLLSAAVLAWDAAANESLSLRSVALAVFVGAAGVMFLMIGLRAK